MRFVKRKNSWILFVLFILICIAIPLFHVMKTKWNENNHHTTIPVGYTDDASQLNLTKIDSIIPVSENPEEMIKQLREVIKYAKKNHLKISIAGARHSMGGHTMSKDGLVLNMLPYKHMHLDTLTNVLTIGAGALWRDAIHYLDGYNKSIAVMQAFSSFSIGGSISVNGHGWQANSGPIASSVISFTLMNVEGQILTCSRDQNTELFHLVLGGYGLFGIVLDVSLQVVENIPLTYHYLRLSPEHYVESYKKFVLDNPRVNMAFGRLRISDKFFLEEATLTFFEKGNDKIELLREQADKKIESRRLVFRSSVNSEYGKRLRWNLETGLNNILKNLVFSRNDLLNDDVSLIENRDSLSTDLLQEYFIPERNFNHFIEGIKPILKRTSIDLLNITIRAVNRDRDSFMHYAKEDVFGFVFLFNQLKTKEQEEEMKILTNQIFDEVLKNEGTFYLPYRLHIDQTKMRKAYPQATSFFEQKLKYDPDEIFSNKFYEHYK